MIIGEIRERFDIENILLTYREYFRRENFQAARFRRLTGRSLLAKSELIDFIAFDRVTWGHAPRKGRSRTEHDYGKPSALRKKQVNKNKTDPKCDLAFRKNVCFWGCICGRGEYTT